MAPAAGNTPANRSAATPRGTREMDHHTSWFHWAPGYQHLLDWLNGSYNHTVVFPPGKHDFDTVAHLYGAWLVAFVLVLLSLYARMKLSDVEKAIIPPRKLGVLAFFELTLDVVVGMMQGVLGPTYKRYVPMIFTLALYILFSNLLGLIPGMVPPTDNLNTNLAPAVVVFLWFNYHGLRDQGFHHITHILNPVGEWWGWFLAPLLGLIEIISLIVRPVALGLRLAGNMIGDHTVLFIFAGFLPLLLPLPFYALGTLVCLIQAAVFCILSTVYIALHVHVDEAAH
jgi:F-type H+-transporting ATPase subunit a